MLQGHGSVKSLHDINQSPLSPSYPVGELHVIGDSGAKHDDTNVLWQHDDGLFPDHTSLLIVDVMHFVKNHPFDVTNHLSPTVQVVTKDLCCHNYACSLLVH